MRRSNKFSTLVVGMVIILGIGSQAVSGKSVFDMHPLWGSILLFLFLLAPVMGAFENSGRNR